jgi:acylphosphatase
MAKAIRCYISGRVQGVFFRASTRKQAKALGLTGWARNLPDGRVDVFACGDEQRLQQLRAWLNHGPQHAQVTAIECETVNTESFPDDFTTG